VEPPRPEVSNNRSSGRVWACLPGCPPKAGMQPRSRPRRKSSQVRGLVEYGPCLALGVLESGIWFWSRQDNLRAQAHIPVLGLCEFPEGGRELKSCKLESGFGAAKTTSGPRPTSLCLVCASFRKVDGRASRRQVEKSVQRTKDHFLSPPSVAPPFLSTISSILTGDGFQDQNRFALLSYKEPCPRRRRRENTGFPGSVLRRVWIADRASLKENINIFIYLFIYIYIYTRPTHACATDAD
jgi:hypothetical protein